jgi:hypothetical protein
VAATGDGSAGTFGCGVAGFGRGAAVMGAAGADATGGGGSGADEVDDCVVAGAADAAAAGNSGSSVKSFSFGTPPSFGSIACVPESPSSSHAATAMFRAINRTKSKRRSMMALGHPMGPARVPL